jgi:Fic family protein
MPTWIWEQTDALAGLVPGAGRGRCNAGPSFDHCPHINNRKYMGLTHTSRATAWRELSDLVAKGCLVPTGQGGRSSAYEIPWAELA